MNHTRTIRPQDTAMELKCVVARPVLRYLEDRVGLGRMERVIEETGMELNYIEDPANWISLDYFSRLLKKLVDVTGDPRSPYLASLQHTDRVSYGAVGLFLKHLGSPGDMYSLVVRFNPLWNRIAKWQMVLQRKNQCIIRIRVSDHKPDKNNCLAIEGALATVPRHFGLPFARVEEDQCACEGADACVYKISWVNMPAGLWAYMGTLAWLMIGALAAWWVGWAPGSMGWVVLLGLAGYFAGRAVDYRNRLCESYARNEEQASSLLESIRATEKLNEELQRRIEQRTAELSEANRNLEKVLKDLKESQERIIQSERQSAVAVLAAGMAHEMNNPMNAIRLSLQALQEGLPESDELNLMVNTAERATSRCSRIVNDLLSFSREPQQISPITLQDIVAETVTDFRKEHSDECRITTQILSDLFQLHLDRAQIKQALTNILSNAYDAMDGKGEIEISLQCGNGEEILSITDHGPGIEESHRRRIFDPFFTTKKSATRKGTGLGLSIAYQLIQRNGGTIEVQSEKGHGATFVVRFALKANKDASLVTAQGGVHE